MESKSFIIFGIISVVLVGLASFAVLNSSNTQKNENVDMVAIESEVDAVLSESTESEVVEDSIKNGDNDQMAQIVEKPEIKQYAQAPAMQLKEGVDYWALIRTNKGDIKIDLSEKETPITVNNFVFLANEGFYNGVKFHRIMKGFMLQGGDPEGTGRGGPGYTFNDEPFSGEYTRGTLAMANAGPNTNGSQFFIMHQDYELQPAYVIFGKADDISLATVDAIADTPVQANVFGEPSDPLEDVIIESVQILEN